MATKGKNKGKGDPDKKSSKKIEDTPLLEERKEDSPIEENEALSMQDPTPEVVESPQKEPTPEPVYDEPPLTDLIVERYDYISLMEFKDADEYTGWFYPEVYCSCIALYTFQMSFHSHWFITSICQSTC